MGGEKRFPPGEERRGCQEEVRDKTDPAIQSLSSSERARKKSSPMETTHDTRKGGSGGKEGTSLNQANFFTGRSQLSKEMSLNSRVII